MYYDGTGYIQTPSFIIPNTGVLTINAWMKSKINNAINQTIVGAGAYLLDTGFINAVRNSTTDNLRYEYAYTTSVGGAEFSNFFQSLDNQ